ncbi:putative MFS family arabinose efflux permease [Agromyces terreus]|uniref:MFS family arabinose efflux permease n=1 Tax=Agromyces terreus TaxID=424795 RepID=A0A9X2KAH4_9MICO|nr:MFS transporter [Agromyces terreus]MCP2369549.1 putative MFS family arabinose efflux permease [Agromyces terreus]
MTTTPAPSASVWRATGMPALLAVTALGFAGYAVLLPVAPLWAVEGGSGLVGAGWVTGLFMFATVAGQTMVPAALGRFGWAPVLVTGLVLLGLPAPLMLVSADLGPVLFWSGVRGLGFAVLTVAGSSAVAELIEPARRGRALGAWGLAIAGPQLVLLPLAPVVAEHLGYAPVFLAAAVPLLGIVPAVRLARHLAALPPHPTEHVHASQGARAAFVALFRPVAILIAVTLAGGALITFLPQMSGDEVLTAVALFGLTGMAALTRWLIGGPADRFSARALMWPLVLCTVAGLSLTAWAVVDAEATLGWALLGGAALVGVAYGGLQNLTLGEAFAAVGPRDTLLASAVWNIGFDAGTGVGAVVVGALAAGFSFPVALLAAAGVSLATLPLALVRRRVSLGR